MTADVTSTAVPALSTEAWLRLHELRLRRFAPAVGNEAEEALVNAGFVIARGSNAAITPAGLEAHATWARLAPGSPEEETASAAYERFLVLNNEFLRLCTEWQLDAGNVSDDTTEAARRWKMLERLDRIDERVGPLLERLSGKVERFATYRGRLTAALDKVGDDTAWLTSPRCDSYHTVWMQLHEDLLAAVGRTRAEEAPPQ